MGKSLDIEFDGSDRAETLEKWIDLILVVILGHDRAFVSDRSTISDFRPSDKDEIPAWLKGIQDNLGVPVARHDYIVDVAQRLKDLHEK